MRAAARVEKVSARPPPSSLFNFINPTATEYKKSRRRPQRPQPTVMNTGRSFIQRGQLVEDLYDSFDRMARVVDSIDRLARHHARPGDSESDRLAVLNR